MSNNWKKRWRAPQNQSKVLPDRRIFHKDKSIISGVQHWHQWQAPFACHFVSIDNDVEEFDNPLHIQIHVKVQSFLRELNHNETKIEINSTVAAGCKNKIIADFSNETFKDKSFTIS